MSSACAHCGLPAGSARRERATDGPAFCCVGCHLAFHLVGHSLAGRSDRLLGRVVLSAVLAMGVMVFSLSLYGDSLPGERPTEDAAHALRGLYRLGALALSAPVMLLLGAPLAHAVLATRRWLSSDALVLVGTCAAWALSVWNTWSGAGHVYFETATVVLVLVALGKWLDARAKDQARAALETLVTRSTAPISVLENGTERDVARETLRVGDVFRTRPGEAVAVDGEVVEGRSFVDTSSWTGEEEPRAVQPGDVVLAGSTLVDGSLVVRATATDGTCVRDEIERRLREAGAAKPSHVRLADRVAAALLPIVIAIAVGATAYHWSTAGPERALLIGLSVVLISCPCALGLATPYAFWIALGEAWKHGALVRGSDVLERLARTRRVFFDKTGTLTTGEMTIASIRVLDGRPIGEVRTLAAALERGSEHPIGRALRNLESGGPEVDAFRALPGIGVQGVIAGVAYTLRRAAAETGDASAPGASRIALLAGDHLVAEFELTGALRPSAAAAIAQLERRSFAPRILTGDGTRAAEHIARTLGVAFEAELLPDAKVARLSDAADRYGTVFVGDGRNDTAALAAADVGIAMPTGARPTLDAASVTLMRADLTLVPWLIELSQRAVRTARANLVWAFAYNGVGLTLAATGRLSPIFAATAMVVSSVLVVLNSRRLQSSDASDSSPRVRYAAPSPIHTATHYAAR